MRVAALALSLVVGIAQAEVIECQQKHEGARLVGASIYEGPQKEHELMGGRKEVRGGQDVHFGFNGGEMKWLACWYKPATPVWLKVDSAAKRCDLRERTVAGKVAVKVTCG
jgi:hypothetical protein